MKIDTEILCSFIDGELDAATATAVRTALDTDENLRQEYEDLRKTSELVRGLPKVSAPPELLQGITANAEREQLLGMTAPTRTGRSGLYWGLSVAASLLIGAAVGILGYHNLQGEPKPYGGPVLVLGEKKELGDMSETFGVGRADSSARSSDTLVLDGRSSSKAGGEEIAALTKSSRRGTAIQGKGDMRIARSGPKSGLPGLSARGAGEDRSGLPGQLAGPSMGGAIATTKGHQQQPESIESLAYLKAKGSPADVVIEDDLESHLRIRAARQLPLEPQVRANNFVNQSMAANLRFEAEPVNVRVVSNDTTKTLQYVQQWAGSNSIIDLNKASPEVNFPVYTQVVYQGRLGTNIDAANEKGLLLRTTRSQARQIVTELQKQEPLVVSVSVRDKKNALGFDVEQLEREKLDLAGGERFIGQQRQDVPAGQSMAEAANKPEVSTQMGIAIESKSKDSGETDSDKVAGFQSRRIATGPQAQVTGTKADEHYLFQITNQMQVSSLEDLVTLVVLVADARCPAEPGQSSQMQIAIPSETDPDATESK